MSKRGSARSTAGEVDATLLALAGLKRLGLAAKARALLDVEEFTPAPGQGAIAITARAGDAAAEATLAPILDEATGLALAAERASAARARRLVPHADRGLRATRRREPHAARNRTKARRLAVF